MVTERRTSITRTPSSSVMSLLSGWAQQGVESFFETQRILVDLATQQNANAMKAVKTHLFGSKITPMTVLTDVAGDGTSNFIEAQKVLLTLAQKQNELVMNGVKEHVDSSIVTAMTEMVRRSVDTFIDMQQHFLNMANKETHAMLEAVKTGKMYKPEGLVHMAREAMDKFVEAQKEFLDVVAEETANAADGKYATLKKTKKTEFTKMAQQATDTFMEAQKKLLDLATQQMGANIKAAGHAADMVPKVSLAPFAELTKDVVKSYVHAHKALLDVMVKPIHKTEHMLTAKTVTTTVTTKTTKPTTRMTTTIRTRRPTTRARAATA